MDKSLFNQRVSVFFQLQGDNELKNTPLLNQIIGDFSHMVLENERELETSHLKELRNICNQGINLSQPEMAAELILNVMFKWPQSTIKEEAEVAGRLQSLRGFLKLIIRKLKGDQVLGPHSIADLQASLICAIGIDYSCTREVFMEVLQEYSYYDDELAEEKFESYIIDWVEHTTHAANMQTDLALINLRALRSIIASHESTRPWAFELVSQQVLPKSIYIIDSLICRWRLMSEPSYRDQSTAQQLSTFDKLIPDEIYRFFSAPMNCGIRWRDRIMNSVDELEYRRLREKVDYICSKEYATIDWDWRIFNVARRELFWSDYLRQATGLFLD